MDGWGGHRAPTVPLPLSVNVSHLCVKVQMAQQGFQAPPDLAPQHRPGSVQHPCSLTSGCSELVEFSGRFLALSHHGGLCSGCSLHQEPPSPLPRLLPAVLPVPSSRKPFLLRSGRGALCCAGTVPLPGPEPTVLILPLSFSVSLCAGPCFQRLL